MTLPFALTMFVASSSLIVFVVAQASGHDLEIQSSPAYLIVGKANGEIARCLFDSPGNCETFHEGEKSEVWSTVLHGEYLYAALDSKKILRCEWQRKNSCKVYYEAKYNILTLTVFDGYLHAGGGQYLSGVVLRCEVHRPNSCSLLQSFPNQVTDIYELNNYMYIATLDSLLRCSKGTKLQCSSVRLHKDSGLLFSVSHLGNTIITLRITDTDVRYYNQASNSIFNYTLQQKVSIRGATYKITVFTRNVYVLELSGRIKKISGQYGYFKEFARHDNVHSISFAYATHRMHHYVYGISKCIEQSSYNVFNYNVEHRAMLEVRVVDGRLQDARGAVLDTRRADRGSSGPAAVFAMGPGGQLLLSHAHSSGLVHISSLFAGQPVAGAGEIVVEDGVVKRIIACSVAYWPDIKLNKQVVDELYRRGYDKADEIKLETCDYTCDGQ